MTNRFTRHHALLFQQESKKRAASLQLAHTESALAELAFKDRTLTGTQESTLTWLERATSPILTVTVHLCHIRDYLEQQLGCAEASPQTVWKVFLRARQAHPPGVVHAPEQGEPSAAHTPAPRASAGALLSVCAFRRSEDREGWRGLQGSGLCEALEGPERFRSRRTDTGTRFAPHGSYKTSRVSHWGSVKRLRSEPPGLQGREVLLLPRSVSFGISPQGTPSPPRQPRGRGGSRCRRRGRSARPLLSARPGPHQLG